MSTYSITRFHSSSSSAPSLKLSYLEHGYIWRPIPSILVPKHLGRHPIVTAQPDIGGITKKKVVRQISGQGNRERTVWQAEVGANLAPIVMVRRNVGDVMMGNMWVEEQGRAPPHTSYRREASLYLTLLTGHSWTVISSILSGRRSKSE